MIKTRNRKEQIRKRAMELIDELTISNDEVK